jgi:hypothetical protein
MSVYDSWETNFFDLKSILLFIVRAMYSSSQSKGTVREWMHCSCTREICHQTPVLPVPVPNGAGYVPVGAVLTAKKRNKVITSGQPDNAHETIA